MAERGGFEPPVEFPLRRFSKPVLSATQSPLRMFRGRYSIAPSREASSSKIKKYENIFETPPKVAIKKLEHSMLTKNTLRLFSPASLFESGIYCGATSCANFTNWRLATNAFARWITEPLHPASF
jgi:hypothetical protein